MKFRILLMLLLVPCVAFSAEENVVFETEWINSEETEKKLIEMDGNRLFPCKIEGKIDGIAILYKSYYCPFYSDMKYFYSHWGMSDYWYETYTRDYLREGYIEYSRTSFEDLGGNMVHQVTWTINAEPNQAGSSGPLDGLIQFLEDLNRELSSP